MDILDLIRSRGLTVTWVAKQAGITRPTLYELNDPAKNPTLKTVRAVAKVLGVTPTHIRPELAE